MSSVLSLLASEVKISQIKGIMLAAANGSATSEEIALIEAHTSDGFEFAGRKVSEYAIATLHILGARAYDGDNWSILHLIQELPDFKL